MRGKHAGTVDSGHGRGPAPLRETRDFVNAFQKHLHIVWLAVDQVGTQT